MYKILNIFFRSIYFDKLPKFFSRKLFKIFKIFFVDTELQSLPSDNHPTKINDQTQIFKDAEKRFYKPWSTCSYLLELLTLYSTYKENLKFYDFGANNIDNYLYLNKYLNKWQYIYRDLPVYNDEVKKIINQKNYKNILVDSNFELSERTLDFAFFGSSIHYVSDYKSVLKKFFENKTKYLIFSHTPFFISGAFDKDRVLKQLNIHPTINYLYLLHHDNFINFMKKNNYQLISQNKNNFIKFLNFKNFSKDYSSINFFDMNFARVN